MCIYVEDKVLVLYILWQTYSEGGVLALSLSLLLSLMCFPCVLERQTQLHFNDTQMLLGFSMHVCMRVCMSVFVEGCVFFLTTSVKSLLKLLLLCTTPPQNSLYHNSWPQVVYVCACERAWVFFPESWSPKCCFWVARPLIKWVVSIADSDCLTFELFSLTVNLSFYTHIYMHVHTQTAGSPRTRWDRQWASNDPENRTAAEW